MTNKIQANANRKFMNDIMAEGERKNVNAHSGYVIPLCLLVLLFLSYLLEKRNMKPIKQHHSEGCYSSVEQMPEVKA